MAVRLIVISDAHCVLSGRNISQVEGGRTSGFAVEKPDAVLGIILDEVSGQCVGVFGLNPDRILARAAANVDKERILRVELAVACDNRDLNRSCSTCRRACNHPGGLIDG